VLSHRLGICPSAITPRGVQKCVSIVHESAAFCLPGFPLPFRFSGSASADCGSRCGGRFLKGAKRLRARDSPILESIPRCARTRRPVLMASAYGSSGRHRPCPQSIHLRAVAAETQGVIAVRAHFPAISKPRRMLSASVTDVTFSATTPAGLALRLASGWGHLTSSTRILIRRSDRRGHTPCVRLRTRGARRGMRKQEGVLPKSRDDVQRAQHPAEAVDVTASVGT
jgi:hypothetical protein